MNLSELETIREGKKAEMAALLDARDQASRDFTNDEATRFDALEVEIKELNAKIDREKRAEEMRKQVARDKAATASPEEKVAKRYSFQNAIGGILRGKLDGVEAEMSQEAENEMKRSGISAGVQGFGLPSFMVKTHGRNVMGAGQVRDLSSGGAATGQELVPDLDMGHIYGLNVRPMVAMLGATVMTGLTGDVYFTKSGTVSAVWEGENDANAEVTPATSRVEMSPKRLGAFADISKTLLTQTGNLAEQIVRREIETAIAIGIDNAAIEGNGGTITGITGVSGANDVSLGSPDGGAPTRIKLLEMEKLILEDNADLSAMAFLTTPGVRYFLKNLQTDTGSGLFVWDSGNTIVGIPAYTSNNVPSDLTKGGGTNLHAILLGCWDQLLIGQWGGLDIVVNPYTRAKENILEIVVNSHWDVDFRHAQAFARILDADIS